MYGRVYAKLEILLEAIKVAYEINTKLFSENRRHKKRKRQGEKKPRREFVDLVVLRSDRGLWAFCATIFLYLLCPIWSYVFFSSLSSSLLNYPRLKCFVSAKLCVNYIPARVQVDEIICQVILISMEWSSAGKLDTLHF